MPAWGKYLSYCALAAAASLIFGSQAYASITNGGIVDPYKYAWGDKLGWINLNPSNGGLNITDTAITGYGWSDNFGWINFNPTNGGVTNNCEGTLGGYAWSSELGWINLTGVTISSAGVFNGTAGTAGTSAGRINFSCATCNVITDWRPCAVRPSGGGGTPGGGGSSPSPSPSPTPAPTPTPTPEPTPTPTPVPEPTPTPVTPPTTPPTQPVHQPAPVTPPTPTQEPTTPPPEGTNPPEITPTSIPAGGGAEGGTSGGESGVPSGESGGGGGGGAGYLPESESREGLSLAGIAAGTSSIPFVPGPIQPIVREAAAVTEEVIETVKKTFTLVSSTKIGRQIIETAQQAEQTLAEPEVQAATVPVLASVGIATVTASAGSTALLNYLFFLYTQPLLFLARGKKKKYGVVYNSLSKMPIDLAAVRIKDSTGKILQTKITDMQGRYYFLMDKGKYSLETTKEGFAFPTSLLIGQTQDLPFEELLTSPGLNLDNEATVARNIPLDPKEQLVPLKSLKRKKTLKQILGYLALASTGIAVGAFVLSPNYAYFGLAIFQSVTYLVLRRLTLIKKPPSYGVVKDARTGKPLSNAVVRIMDTRFNRVLETQISDSKGRYAFLVGHGDFYVTAVKEGYQTLRSEPIACPISKEPTVIDKALSLVQIAPVTQPKLVI
jgi:hypothetical protein